MEQGQRFWQRSFYTMRIKYLGWDWRVIPLLGFVGLITSAIWLRGHIGVAFGLGYAVLLALAVCWNLAVHDVWKGDKIAFEKRIEELKPLEELSMKQIKNARNFVFPYIRSISASPIIDAEEDYVSFSLCLPTSLLNSIELTLTGELIIDGQGSKELSPKPCKLSLEAMACISDWHAFLTNRLVQLVKEKTQTNKPIRVSIRLWDMNNKGEYHWETEQWTTLLLTKLG